VGGLIYAVKVAGTSITIISLAYFAALPTDYYYIWECCVFAFNAISLKQIFESVTNIEDNYLNSKRLDKIVTTLFILSLVNQHRN
jgi:hypothetical protein